MANKTMQDYIDESWLLFNKPASSNFYTSAEMVKTVEKARGALWNKVLDAGQNYGLTYEPYTFASGEYEKDLPDDFRIGIAAYNYSDGTPIELELDWSADSFPESLYKLNNFQWTIADDKFKVMKTITGTVRFYYYRDIVALDKLTTEDTQIPRVLQDDIPIYVVWKMFATAHSPSAEIYKKEWEKILASASGRVMRVKKPRLIRDAE